MNIGGAELLEEHNGEDITQLFHDDASHEHSESALKMLQKYKIGTIEIESSTTSEDSDNKSSESNSKLKAQGKKIKQAKEEEEHDYGRTKEGFPKVEGNIVEYENFKLDVSKGVAYQLMKLPLDEYLRVIHTPVHVENLRLYDSPFFEYFSHNKWYHIVGTWVPLILGLLIYGIFYQKTQNTAVDKFVQWSSEDFSFFMVIFEDDFVHFGCIPFDNHLVQFVLVAAVNTSYRKWVTIASASTMSFAETPAQS